MAASEQMRPGLLLQNLFFDGGPAGFQLQEEFLLRGVGAPAGPFQMIDTFVCGNPGDPGLLVPAIETGEVFVCGEKRLLCQILRVKIIAGQAETNGKDQILILVNQMLKLFLRLDRKHLPSFLSSPIITKGNSICLQKSEKIDFCRENC